MGYDRSGAIGHREIEDSGICFFFKKNGQFGSRSCQIKIPYVLSKREPFAALPLGTGGGFSFGRTMGGQNDLRSTTADNDKVIVNLHSFGQIPRLGMATHDG